MLLNVIWHKICRHLQQTSIIKLLAIAQLYTATVVFGCWLMDHMINFFNLLIKLQKCEYTDHSFQQSVLLQKFLSAFCYAGNKGAPKSRPFQLTNRAFGSLNPTQKRGHNCHLSIFCLQNEYLKLHCLQKKSPANKQVFFFLYLAKNKVCLILYLTLNLQ